MAVTSTLVGKSVFGNKRCAWGTWTAAGDINTEMRECEVMLLQTGTAVSADQCSVNETMPCDGSAVSFTCTGAAVGFWFAIGT